MAKKISSSKLDKLIALFSGEDSDDELDEEDQDDFDEDETEDVKPINIVHNVEKEKIDSNESASFTNFQRVTSQKSKKCCLPAPSQSSTKKTKPGAQIIPKTEPIEDLSETALTLNDYAPPETPAPVIVQLDVAPIKIESSSEDEDDEKVKQFLANLRKSNDPLKASKAAEKVINSNQNDHWNNEEFDTDFDTDDEIPLALREGKPRVKTEIEIKIETTDIVNGITKDTEMKDNDQQIKKNKKKNKRPIEKFLKCTVCSVFRKNEEYLDLHMKTHEGLIKSELECHICGKQFSTTCSVIRHHSLHEAAFKHQCEKCGKRFIFSSSLHSHKFKHETSRPHQCSICPQTFKAYKHLKRHLFCHTGEKPFECIVCKKRFTERYMLTTHQKVHVKGKQTHTCELCGQLFKLQKKYEYHLKRHAEPKPEKPPKLTKAGRPFAKRPHLRKKKFGSSGNPISTTTTVLVPTNLKTTNSCNNTIISSITSNVTATITTTSNSISQAISSHTSSSPGMSLVQQQQHHHFTNIIQQNSSQFEMQKTITNAISNAILEKAFMSNQNKNIINQHNPTSSEIRIKNEYDKDIKNFPKLPFNPLFQTKTFNPFSPFKMEIPDIRNENPYQYHRDSTGDGNNSMFS